MRAQQIATLYTIRIYFPIDNHELLLITIFHLASPHSHIFMNSPKAWWLCFLLPFYSPPGSPLTPNPGNPKSHLSLFYATISCWHLYLLIKNNLEAGSHSITWIYMQTPGLGAHT